MSILDRHRLAAFASGKSTRRAAMLGAAAGLAVGKLGLSAARAEAAQTNDFASGGLGLSQNSFAEMYGGGQVGQGALIYEINGATYAVAGLRDLDIVSSICWFPEGQDTIALSDAFSVIEQFLPADASLREVYTTPAAGIGPFAMVEIYKSAGLAKVVAGLPTIVTSGSFMSAYNIGGGLDSNVSAVNAFIGDRPTG
jgi:hypothetical protein